MSAPSTPEASGADRRQAVAAQLIEYGASQKPAGRWKPTLNEDANELLRDDPFAFLCALIFNRQIPAEQAWHGPLRLRQRLGHLDVKRLAGEEPAIRAAIERPPALHRFAAAVAHGVSDAARRVLDEYGGDAVNIWSDNPRAGDLARRLSQFYGLGQKTAAVGVANIAWWMGWPVQHMEEADIAYDVHVRRVFLRAQLASHDDQAHMIAMARELNPAHPGAIDYGAWLIGRDYCRPQSPRCAGCPLSAVCPKDTARAAQVRGA